MSKNIRYSFLAAMTAVAISAASASAAPPAWYVGVDRNNDGVLTWNEFVRNDRAFEVLDENGDRRISKHEGFGQAVWQSSWDKVSSFDVDSNGAVTRNEYQKGIRTLFNTVDANHDGAISEVELSGNA